MVGAMAFNNTKNTETTDIAADEDEAGGLASEQSQESSAQQITDADADIDRQQDNDELGTADEANGNVTEVNGAAAEGTGLRGFAAGAAAVVSAGVGLSSLTGTPLSEMLRNRQDIIGQIQTSSGAGGDQVEAVYGAPWHAAALMNGLFALLAVLLGGALLVGLAHRPDSRQWVRAVALGGVVLGVIGLVVAGAMYLDIFPQPELPPTPLPPG